MTTHTFAKPILIGAAATALASCLAGYIWHEQQRPPLLEVYVFALKSGRSMFIRTPDDRRVLVDGGANAEVVRHLTDILPFYSRRIDAVIVTNTEAKNVSGLIDVTERYEVERVYVPKFTLENIGLASSTDKVYETFVNGLSAAQIRVDAISAGDQIPLSGFDYDYDGERAIMQVLFPVLPEKFDYSKASAPEVLFDISYGNTSTVFMGDASKKVQKFVASFGDSIIPNADVLIVSHGAAATNMSPEFMDIVRPESLIYEKAVTKSSDNQNFSGKKSISTKTQAKDTSTNKKVSKNSSKKIVADPLAAILDENRFNLKEVGTVKIVSDGEGVIVGADNE